MADVAADLSRRLNTRVIVGPTMENETIWVKFSELPLEPALSSLAPRVYIDYEIRQDAQPAPLGIYLLGSVDPEPAINAVVRGSSQGLLDHWKYRGHDHRDSRMIHYRCPATGIV